ncbi:MAG: hypothetical protein OXG78_14340 [Chloroflexi bacterium]|nr:hypothetical protein [Chloroflexota bacterium]
MSIDIVDTFIGGILFGSAIFVGRTLYAMLKVIRKVMLFSTFHMLYWDLYEYQSRMACKPHTHILKRFINNLRMRITSQFVMVIKHIQEYEKESGSDALTCFMLCDLENLEDIEKCVWQMGRMQIHYIRKLDSLIASSYVLKQLSCLIHYKNIRKKLKGKENCLLFDYHKPKKYSWG